MTDIKEAQGLKVVAWQDAENPLYTTGEKRQVHGWATDGYPIVELIRLSDATAVIDQLKAENERLKAQMPEYDELCYQHGILQDVANEIKRERDALRKKLDEARELLAVASEIIHEQAIHIDRPMTDLGSEALTRLDDWLEANKP